LSICIGGLALLSFLTAVNNNNKRASYWLALFFLCICFTFLDEKLITNNIYARCIHLYGFFPLALLLIGPTFYMAVISFITPNKKWNRKEIRYFSLPILYIILNIPFFFTNSNLKHAYLEKEYLGADYLIIVSFFTFFISTFIFISKSVKKLKSHQKRMLSFSAKDEEVQLQWLINSAKVLLGMIAYYFLTSFFSSSWIELSFHFSMIIAIFLLAFFSIKQKEIFSKKVKDKQQIEIFLDHKKSETSNEGQEIFSKSEINYFLDKLDHIMTNEKLYLDNDLNLLTLSKNLELPSYKLSHLLNHHINENFSNYINKYRVVEAKNILSNVHYKKYTMLQVAFEAGFSSKTVFNTHFKKVVGVSPSDFRKKYEFVKKDVPINKLEHKPIKSF